MNADWVRVLFFVGVGAMLMQNLPTAQAEPPLVFISAFAAGDEGAIHSFHLDLESGQLAAIERTTDVEGQSYCADVKITPDGRFLYGTNRGHDSIAAYRIGEDGRLTLVAIEPSLGKGPQNLAIAPGGRLLLCANMPGNNVAVFRIDPQTGRLTSAGPPVSLPKPSRIRVLKP